jgi:hypothetical protein
VSSQTCPVAHKFPEPSEHFVLGSSGRVCAVRPPRLTGPVKGGGRRGQVRGWSAASRRRMLFAVGSLDFAGFVERHGGRWVSMTLTYHLDDPGPDRFALDRYNFIKRLSRRQGYERWIWKVEFQRRGMVHMHLCVWVPSNTARYLADLRRWTWNNWEAVTGGHNGVDVRWSKAADFARYLAADWSADAKGYQYRVPDSWDKVGRWWGITGIYGAWATRRLTRAEFFTVHRVMRRYRRSQVRRPVRCGRGRSPTRHWVLGQNVGSFRADIDRLLVSSRG